MRGSRGSSGSSKPRGRAGAWAMVELSSAAGLAATLPRKRPSPCDQARPRPMPASRKRGAAVHAAAHGLAHRALGRRQGRARGHGARAGRSSTSCCSSDLWNRSGSGRFRSDCVYRGEGPLATERPRRRASSVSAGRRRHSRRHLLRSFRKYAHRDDVPNDSAWHWLALAQAPRPADAAARLDALAVRRAALRDRRARFATTSDGVVWTIDYVHASRALPAAAADGARATRARTSSRPRCSTAPPANPAELDALAEDERLSSSSSSRRRSTSRIVNQFARVLVSCRAPRRRWTSGWRPARRPRSASSSIPADLKWRGARQARPGERHGARAVPGLDGMRALAEAALPPAQRLASSAPHPWVGSGPPRTQRRGYRCACRVVTRCRGSLTIVPRAWATEPEPLEHLGVAAPARTTLTTSSRKTGWPRSASTSGRARVPISLTIAPLLPTRICFCDSVSTRTIARTTFSPISSTSTVIACGTSSRVSWSAFSRISSAICSLERQVGRLLEREVRLALGQQRDEIVRATRRSRRLSSRSPGGARGSRPSCGGGLHLRGDVTGLQPVDLVERDDHRHAEREHAPRDEAVARADPLARGERRTARRRRRRTRASTVRCIRSVSASIGRWNPGRSTSTSCQSVAVGDTEDPPPRRVAASSETIATLSPRSALTSVDLPTFGRPRRRRSRSSRGLTAGSRPHRVHGRPAASPTPIYDTRVRPNRVERAVSTVASPSVTCRRAQRALGVTTISPGSEHDAIEPNSCSHWRQPPHGDAVIAIASKSPGPVALGDRARKRGPLRADAERVRGVLDVHALDHAAVARQDGAADEELASTARRRARRPRRPARAARRRSCAEHLEDDERDERAEQPAVATTSNVEWTPASTRVCATSSAMMNVSGRDRGSGARTSSSDERHRHPAARTRPPHGPTGARRAAACRGR